MARIEKTVFISYRQVDRWPALAVFNDLTQHGYDVFIDYDGIASGDFERAIVDNIRARAHFIVVLTPTALERCDDPADWLRREIEVALDAKRNMVPLLLDGFRFDAPIAVQRLQGSLEPLRRYQALKVPEDFFDAAMERLRSKYLAVAVEAVLHPPSAHAQQVAHEQHDAASKAAALAPAEEKMVAHSAEPTAQQRAQGQRAAVVTNEGQEVIVAPNDGVVIGAATVVHTHVVPAHAKPSAWLKGFLAIAVSAFLVWFVVSSGWNNQGNDPPSATAPPSIVTPQTTKQPERGRIGIQIQEVTKEVAVSFGLPKPTGALVNGVQKDGPAEKGGVQAGDVILKVDGHEVRLPSDLPRITTAIRPGTKIAVSVWRNGAVRDLAVTIEAMQ